MVTIFLVIPAILGTIADGYSVAVCLFTSFGVASEVFSTLGCDGEGVCLCNHLKTFVLGIGNFPF